MNGNVVLTLSLVLMLVAVTGISTPSVQDAIAQLSANGTDNQPSTSPIIPPLEPPYLVPSTNSTSGSGNEVESPTIPPLEPPNPTPPLGTITQFDDVILTSDSPWLQQPIPDIHEGKNLVSVDQFSFTYFKGIENGAEVFEQVAHPKYILNTDNEWVPFIITETSDYVIVESNMTPTIKYDKVNCAYTVYGSGYAQESNKQLPAVSWVSRVAPLDTDEWTQLSELDSQSCQVTITQEPKGYAIFSVKELEGVRTDLVKKSGTVYTTDDNIVLDGALSA